MKLGQPTDRQIARSSSSSSFGIPMDARLSRILLILMDQPRQDLRWQGTAVSSASHRRVFHLVISCKV